ncbi:alpha-amylase family glycosyl hydrolase [Dyadobacter sp. MSC1_007]|jgi:alpha-glucosidase|uniref:alpha-amylase family glycosyl hydrolase n=1 Tax=Dyadobacter sp. MSC1_007 TaxID=2909264 RepID=UPI00202E317A|nr:alpha-amylase family glycosyl hydrolase [Dyadobacter sp. MSC1_007]
MENALTNTAGQSDYFWWQTGTIYQIYPRSFCDSDGDGVGDLQGIITKLDYLQWLGIDCIWLSPIFPSPMADFGYDISDYKGIHPLFGTMADFDELVGEVHSRNMKILLDLVPNHTSDQHPWFIESRSSRTNPKRDWYLWQDAREDGGLPNNWLSVFGGPAWEWDEATGQYYYHAFAVQQPDLNWRNPEVQQAMLDVMRFWLEKGIDGFRVDVMWHMIKDLQLRDNPALTNLLPGTENRPYYQFAQVYSTDQPEVHDIVRMMRALTDKFDQRVLIGEIYLPVEKLVTYYGHDSKGAHLPFNFQLLQLPWEPMSIAMAIDTYEGSLPASGWPNWVLGNHDKPRIASRVGRDQARVAAVMLLTLRGTPTLYYGDEIGMRDVPIPKHEIVDPQGVNMPELNISRDPARTPMQWNSQINAGFSRRKPWLRVADDAGRINVEAGQKDPYSMLSFYHRLLALRKSEPALHIGTYSPLYSDNQIIAYFRQYENDRFLIVLNLSHRPAYLTPRQDFHEGKIALSTEYERIRIKTGPDITLNGDEALVIRVTQTTPPTPGL